MINLLPSKEKIVLRQEYKMRLLIVVFFAISILSIIFSIFLAPSYKYSVLKEGIAKKNLELFNSENPDIDVEKLNNEIVKTNEKLSFILSKKSNVFVSESVLEKILLLRTTGISFSQISFDSNSKSVINIFGKAQNRSALKNFKEALGRESAFAVVDLPISNFIKPSDIDFH